MTDTTTTTTSSTRRPGTGDGDDRLTELHEQITAGVAALVDSDAWQAMLDTAARFHPYSLGNLLLIAVQAPAATRVAGFRSWQSLGRQVRKGERGIAILAPCTYRSKRAADTQDSQQPPAEPGGVAAADRPARPQVRGFRRAYVFDIAQTDRTGPWTSCPHRGRSSASRRPRLATAMFCCTSTATTCTSPSTSCGGSSTRSPVG